MKNYTSQKTLRILKHFGSYTATIFSEEMQYSRPKCIATRMFEYPQVLASGISHSVMEPVSHTGHIFLLVPLVPINVL